MACKAKDDGRYIPTLGVWPPNVQKKQEHMTRKNQEARDLFNLSGMERVIQDYYCTLKRTLKHPGRLFVTQSFICFHSSIPTTVNMPLSISD